MNSYPMTIRTYSEQVKPTKLLGSNLYEVDKGNYEQINYVPFNQSGWMSITEWRKQTRKRKDFVAFVDKTCAKINLPTYWGIKSYQLVRIHPLSEDDLRGDVNEFMEALDQVGG
jgi:hypothetical protein